MTDELVYAGSDDASPYQYSDIEIDDGEPKFGTTSTSTLDRVIEAEKELIAHSMVLGDLTGKYNSQAKELHRIKVLTTVGLCLIAGAMAATFICLLVTFGDI